MKGCEYYMFKNNKQSILGEVSFALGIFNVLLSIFIFWALWSWINQKFGEMIYLQSLLLNIGSTVELITKPLGLILGIISLFLKTKLKTFSIIAIIINAIVILWTIAVFAGLII